MQVTRNTQTRRPVENVIPMINVVFLLLVFFLITARIAPPLPVEVDLPDAEGVAFEGGTDDVVLDRNGVVYFAGESGDAVWPVLADRQSDGALTLRADRAAPGAALARTLAQINARTGVTVNLVAEN